MNSLSTNAHARGARRPGPYFAAALLLIVGVPSALAALSNVLATPAPAALSVEG